LINKEKIVKTFIINSKDNLKKRGDILEECKKHNIEPQIFEAIMGKDLSEAELQVLVKDHNINGLTKGEIGCSLSHIGIYKKIVDEKIDLALILEDDAALRDNIVQAMKEIGEFNKTINKPFVYLLTPIKGYIENHSIKLKSVILYDIYRADYTYGYIVNYEAAKRLVEYLMPVRWTADNWKYFKYAAGINVYGAVPNIIYERKTESVIGDRSYLKDMRNKYKNKLFLSEIRVQIKIFINRVLFRPFLRVKSNNNQDEILQKLKRHFAKRKK
jgi:glycosyl transferase family 25